MTAASPSAAKELRPSQRRSDQAAKRYRAPELRKAERLAELTADSKSSGLSDNAG